MDRTIAAARVTRIKLSPSTMAAARARELKTQGRDIVDLTVGEPDFDTPDHIKAAAHAAIERGDTKYTPVNGTAALRAAIRNTFRRRTGVEYDDARIVVGNGAKPLIFNAFLASLDAGDEVIIPAPYWVSYPDMVLACDGQPVIVPCREADGFQLTAAALEAAITPRTRWLILNSPGNPTGALYGQAMLRELADVLLRHPQVYVLTDDIYDEIVFDGARAVSLVQIEPQLVDRVLQVNGCSKSYAMTGWRLGYGVGPAPLIKAMNTLQSQMASCASSISQAAAVAALNGDQRFIADCVQVYQERRDVAVRILNQIEGLHCQIPAGAFYLFPNCAGVIGKRTPDGKRIETDLDLALYLLDAQGVAVIHGGAYGVSPYLRLSIATDQATVVEGCKRIAKALAQLV